jgi:hypothetical protein
LVQYPMDGTQIVWNTFVLLVSRVDVPNASWLAARAGGMRAE